MNRIDPEPIAVSILAKAPIPGFAKTRLADRLGTEGAAALQARLIVRAIQVARAAEVGPIILWAAPDDAHPVFRTEGDRIAVRRQPDTDLGERMFTALANACPGVVIGTDCPALIPEHLRLAAGILREGLDAVAIPAEDGGYVLIGTRRPSPLLFADIAWSTPGVMTETRRRLSRLGFSWREPARLWDVDRPEDLERMRREGLADLLA